MADDESESGMESGWESDGGNELRMAARLGQQLLRQKQELAARLEVVDKENERLRDRLVEWDAFSEKMGSEGYPSSPRSAWEQSSRAFERLSTLLREMQEKSARVVQLEAACSDLAADNKELRGEAVASSREIESMRKRTIVAGGGGGGGDNGDGAMAVRKAQDDLEAERRTTAGLRDRIKVLEADVSQFQNELDHSQARLAEARSEVGKLRRAAKSAAAAAPVHSAGSEQAAQVKAPGKEVELEEAMRTIEELRMIIATRGPSSQNAAVIGGDFDGDAAVETVSSGSQTEPPPAPPPRRSDADEIKARIVGDVMGLASELSALSSMCEEVADEIGSEARNLRVEWISKNRREIAAALEDLAKSRGECEALRGELVEERADSAARRTALEGARKEAEALSVERGVLKEEVEMMRGEIDRQVMAFGEERTAIRAEGEAHKSGLDRLWSECENLKSELDMAKVECDRHVKVIEGLRADTGANRAEADRRESELEALRAEARGSRNGCDAARREAEDANGRAEALREEVGVWRERAGEAERKIEGLRAEVEKARDGSKASSEQLQVALDTAHSRYAGLLVETEGLKAQLARDGEALSEALRNNEKLQQECSVAVEEAREGELAAVELEEALKTWERRGEELEKDLKEAREASEVQSSHIEETARLREQVADARKELDAQSASTSRLTKERDALSADLARAREEVAKKNEEVQCMRGERDAESAGSRELRISTAKLQSSLDSALARGGLASAEIADLNGKMAEAVRDKEEMKRVLEETKEAVKRSGDKVSELERVNGDLWRERDELEVKVGELEEAVRREGLKERETLEDEREGWAKEKEAWEEKERVWEREREAMYKASVSWEEKERAWNGEEERWVKEKGAWEEERENLRKEEESWEEKAKGMEGERGKWEKEKEVFECERGEWGTEKEGWVKEREGWEKEREGWEKEREAWEKEREGWEGQLKRWEEGVEKWQKEKEIWESEKGIWGAEKEGWVKERGAWEEEREGWGKERGGWEEEKKALQESRRGDDEMVATKGGGTTAEEREGWAKEREDWEREREEWEGERWEWEREREGWEREMECLLEEQMELKAIHARCGREEGGGQGLDESARDRSERDAAALADAEAGLREARAVIKTLRAEVDALRSGPPDYTPPRAAAPGVGHRGGGGGNGDAKRALFSDDGGAQGEGGGGRGWAKRGGWGDCDLVQVLDGVPQPLLQHMQEGIAALIDVGDRREKDSKDSETDNAAAAVTVTVTGDKSASDGESAREKELEQSRLLGTILDGFFLLTYASLLMANTRFLRKFAGDGPSLRSRADGIPFYEWSNMIRAELRSLRPQQGEPELEDDEDELASALIVGSGEGITQRELNSLLLPAGAGSGVPMTPRDRVIGAVGGAISGAMTIGTWLSPNRSSASASAVASPQDGGGKDTSALQSLCQRLLGNNISLGERIKALVKRRKELELALEVERVDREEERQRADAIKGVCDLLAKEVGEREEEISGLEAMLSGNATSADVENRKKKSSLKKSNPSPPAPGGRELLELWYKASY